MDRQPMRVAVGRSELAGALGEEVCRCAVKASKFTEAPKGVVLKQGEEGTPVAEICRKAGLSEATFTYPSTTTSGRAGTRRIRRRKDRSIP
jgi:putative transposase